MGVNGKKETGELVTINLSRWQVFIGILLALILGINALFALADNIQGEEVHYVEDGKVLEDAIAKAVGFAAEGAQHERDEIKALHDKDIAALKENQQRLEIGLSRLNDKLDRILNILLEK